MELEPALFTSANSPLPRRDRDTLNLAARALLLYRPENIGREPWSRAVAAVLANVWSEGTTPHQLIRRAARAFGLGSRVQLRTLFATREATGRYAIVHASGMSERGVEWSRVVEIAEGQHCAVIDVDATDYPVNGIRHERIIVATEGASS